MIGEGKRHLEFLIILLDASVMRLLESELMLDHPKGIFLLGSQVGFCRLRQILQSSLRCIGQRAVPSTELTRPEAAATLVWQRIPKNRWFSLATEYISGACSPFLFLVQACAKSLNPG